MRAVTRITFGFPTFPKKFLRNSSNNSKKGDTNHPETPVPTGYVDRLATYGGLVGRMAWRNLTNPKTKASKFDPEMLEDFVRTLCKLRGAALKVGQLLSIQDNAVLPDEVQHIFERVRQSADFMPYRQVETVLKKEIGDDFMTHFESFEQRPFAAASIGQVHKAVLRDGTKVAVKVQYPNIDRSILVDLNSLQLLIKKTNLISTGFFLDNTMEVARRELFWEVDYTREAECQSNFSRILEKYEPFGEFFSVPKVIDKLSTRRVLTTELLDEDATALDKLALDQISQEEKDNICLNLLNLTLHELFVFNYMQTDGNWANFFYCRKSGKICLLDFGATRSFNKSFVNDYMCIIKAAADMDADLVEQYSKKIGFLTGFENKAMREAHVKAILVLGQPFHTEEAFDFGRQDITKQIGTLVPTMLKHRLTPPPDDTYGLHRKMSGIFLLCGRLGARIRCKRLFDEIYSKYEF